ncbi:Bug family tripartite tricarboxylate transporter substrate binding protein [Neoroseomonas soli]|uniref:Tripartite tricarboxylate transporter substrate binding protein n=1 Tax=Neoroseomonas soli TaxID=1081025 RepID=A0A9X9WUG4_9PROT|nr:tripartite tricarboxylate transporter substrate binding protein [Neoroseomonas soli]MBR0670793.1 tripartite tricarboxylate transporter substrate binding protein [Neoroseomonas soli]
MTAITRRAALGALPLLAAPAALRAQPAWPNRPVRFVVPFQAGGATDVTARVLAEGLGAVLGQPFIVDNRAGAGGNIGADLVAKADPDGHTILMGTIGTASINQFLYRRMPFKPEDLAPVALVSQVANGIIVHPSVQATTLAELIAVAKRDPGALNYGTPGNGTSGHLSGEYLKTRAGIDMTHVPFRGTGGVIPELLAGRVQVAVDNLPSYLPLINNGELRLLAVTSRERWFSAPNAPTVQESGIDGFEAVAWFGVQLPARTPAPIVERLSAAVLQTVNDVAFQSKLREVGSEPRPLGPADFARFIAAESTKWREVVRASGAQLD